MNEEKTTSFNMAAFLKMEENFSLFDYRSKEGFPVWDILRFYIFWGEVTSEISQSVLKKKKETLKFYINAFKILSFSLFSFFFCKKDNILFGSTRYLDSNGLFFDMASENVISELAPHLLIVDNVKAFSRNRYKYKIETNFVQYLLPFFRIKNELSKELFVKIQKALKDSFGKSCIMYEELNNEYIQFLKKHAYYRFYFKHKKPKRIFFVQNGIQKGMIYAAKSLNLPVFELQHGNIDKDHPAYAYPEGIVKKDKTAILPDYILTFSNYWGKNMNLPISIIPIGNDCFSECFVTLKDNSILFISSMIHGKYLAELAIQYAALHPDIIINFKLHSNEYWNENFYLEYFAHFNNIHLLKNETSIKNLIAKSLLVVLISSTVLYEALHLGAKVAIYKKLNYYTREDCFSFANVYLIDTSTDLHQAYLAEKKESNTSFFDTFDRERFAELIRNNPFENL